VAPRRGPVAAVAHVAPAAASIPARVQEEPAAAAIIGDTTNYWIGNYIGPRAFSGEIRFLKKEYLDRTHDRIKLVVLDVDTGTEGRLDVANVG